MPNLPTMHLRIRLVSCGCGDEARELRCMQVSTDWVGLIDEWARRFFHELDYNREARSAMQFKEQMKPLGGITVAPVYTELTSGEVLTTAWVQGEHQISGSTPRVCIGSERSQLPHFVMHESCHALCGLAGKDFTQDA